jgi:MFS family permease
MEDVAAAVIERTGRVLASGGKAVARGSRFLGVQLRRGGRAVVNFTASGGAGKTGLARLVHLQFLTAAGDATVAVSLAGTLFFALPTDQARPQVAQFLLLTMAPFAIVAPFIGPFLDRFRHGRRWALGLSLALRAFLCWMLASVLDGSTWLFLSALIFLVASKAFTITRAAAVPRLLPPGFTLVNANSRISMANVVGAAVGGGIAAGIALLGPEWSLRFGFLIFVAATALAILLSPAVDSSAAEGDTSRMPIGSAGQLTETNRTSRRFRDLPPGVVHGLRCVMGARLMTGFLTFFLAFLLREQPIASIDGVLLLGIVVAAAGVGNSLGTIAGNLSKNIAPEKIGLAVLCVDLAMAIITAALYSIVSVIAVGLIAGLCAQLAKLAYDALVQRDVPEVVRTSVFARSETVFQLCWVFGGGLGISLPLIPQLGFGILAALLLGLLVWTVVAWRLRLTRTPRAADSAPPVAAAEEKVG